MKESNGILKEIYENRIISTECQSLEINGVITDTHLLEIQKIETLTFSDAWSLASLRSTELLAHGKIIVCQKSNEILAYLILYKMANTIEIARIAVKSEYRGMGIGKTLLNYVKSHIKDVACDEIILEVRESNKNAINFYKLQGFCSIGTRPNYYKQPVEDAIMFMLK